MSKKQMNIVDAKAIVVESVKLPMAVVDTMDEPSIIAVAESHLLALAAKPAKVKKGPSMQDLTCESLAALTEELGRPVGSQELAEYMIDTGVYDPDQYAYGTESVLKCVGSNLTNAKKAGRPLVNNKTAHTWAVATDEDLRREELLKGLEGLSLEELAKRLA